MSPPRVWLRFERTLKDGTVKKFKVQEVSPSLYGKVIEFMGINFLPEEPFALAASKSFILFYLISTLYLLICGLFRYIFYR